MATALSFSTRRSNMAPATQVKSRVEPEGLAGRQDADDVGRIGNGSTNAEDDADHADVGAESDVDELVDSDTERADAHHTSSTRASRGKGRAAGSVSKKASGNAAGSSKAAATGESKKSTNDVWEGKKSKGGSQGSVLSKSNTHPSSAHSGDAVAANEPKASSEEAPAKRKSPVVHDQMNMADGYGSKGAPAAPSSLELLGRTATGGPLPYYYPQPGVSGGRSTQSPRQASFGKKATMGAQLSKGFFKGEPSSTEGEDLTPQEVDKFMDLIEKYNLDGSNEDEMARSVTELYQEWLEWCAKRNVQSTKSKQALVSEFVRIHHGAYGASRQQRAIGIVQGSRTFDHAGMANAALRSAASNGLGSRTAGTSLSNSSSRDDASSRQKNIKTAATDSSTAPTRVIPSPAVATRSLTPGLLPYEEPYSKGIPPVVLENMHRQIRDEIWKEAGIMINQMLHEQMADVLAENRAMAARIEQLETHSDNLAQWVQHLNRVQEDLSSSFSASAPPLPGRGGHPREEIQREEMHGTLPVQTQQMEHHPYHAGHLGAPRGYPPAYGGPVGSPKRAYVGLHGSPSPPAMSHRSVSRMQPMPHDAYDRHGPPPPPGMAHQHPAYRDSPRAAPGHAASGPGGAYYDDSIRPGPPPPPQGGMHPSYGGEQRGGVRAYYTHPHDDRMMQSHPESPSAVEMRQAKRIRNGY